MQLSEINEKIERGDKKTIARSTGYSEAMVKKVLSGERNNVKIIKAAEMLVKGRQSLEEQIAIMAQN
jgi:hypothetical protein